MGQTDQLLLTGYLRGHDQAAFGQLLKQHAGLVYGVALRHTRNPEDARDVVQEVFILLARKAARLIAHPSIAAWLHKTTHNVTRESSLPAFTAHSTLTFSLIMTKTISITIGGIAVVGILFMQWHSNVELKQELHAAKQEVSSLTAHRSLGGQS